jgi:hypothetical protein
MKTTESATIETNFPILKVGLGMLTDSVFRQSRHDAYDKIVCVKLIDFTRFNTPAPLGKLRFEAESTFTAGMNHKLGMHSNEVMANRYAMLLRPGVNPGQL